VSRDSVGVIWIRLRAPGEVAKAPDATRAPMRLTAPAARSSAVRADTAPASAVHVVVADSARPAPIYFVDGRRASLLPSGKPDLGGLTKDQIDSVEILKGAAAIAAYGPDAANGVVIIKTKKGSGGER
jgi:TonB-dependent SusC/RagA subfamily outer membrane receptor